MENKEILISVGMPVYNGEKYIREALDSAFSQTHANIELIISDNASEDNTEEICREYAKKDPRIRYIRQTENRGIFFNSHFVVQEAKGLYFALLSHDDVLDKNFLEKTSDYLSKHEECTQVSCDVEFIDESGSHIKNLELTETRESIPWKYRCRELFKYPTSSNIYVLTFGLVKTDVIQKVYSHIFSPKAIKGSEVPALCRIATEGQMVSIPNVLRKYRLHDESISKAEWLIINKKPELIKRFIILLNIWQIRFDQARVLWRSKYPLSQKLDIFLWAYKQYFKQLLKRIVRFPKKFLK
jgi:glycosyltransferase involved in cell wall biosynthesis